MGTTRRSESLHSLLPTLPEHLTDDVQFALLDDLPGAVWIANLDGGCTYFNAAWLASRGRTFEEEIGDGWHAGVHPDDFRRLIDARFASIASGEPIEIEYRLRGGDGEYRWMLERASAILSPDGRATGVLGVCLDISARKDAEVSHRSLEELYRGAFEGATGGIIQTSFDGRVLAANPAAAALLGYESPEQLIAEVSDVRGLYVNPQRRDDVLLMLRRRGKLRDYKVHARRRDGATMLVSASARLILNESGRPAGMETTFFDTSERMRDEGMLRDAYEHEHEEGDLLRALDEMKNTFLRAVSHDMRNPLTTILALAETLAASAGRAAPDRLAAMAGDIQKGARNLDRLLTDLLDVERLTRGTVEPSRRRCDVAALIESVIGRLDVGSHPVSVRASGVSASVDPAQLERIVENLVVNAFRHTPPGTPIDVGAAVSPDGLLITVDDRGPGVPDELKTRIFEPFERGNASRGSKGTGIGLSLVAKFAEIHDGRAWVEDRTGDGASFRVLLALPEGRK